MVSDFAFALKNVYDFAWISPKAKHLIFAFAVSRLALVYFV